MSSIIRVTAVLAVLTLAMQMSALGQQPSVPKSTTRNPGTAPKTTTGGTSVQGKPTRQADKPVVAPTVDSPQADRPRAAPLRIEKTVPAAPIDPALEQLLLEWETQSAKIQTLQCTFTKYRYNHRFQTEHRAEGEVKYQAPDHGVYLQLPTTITKDMKGRTKDSAGKTLDKPYDLKADSAQHWVCTGKQVYQINRPAKTFDVAAIPKDIQGQNIVNSPLPFLFGMKAKDAKRRFNMKLLSQNADRHEIMIRAEPRTMADAQNYKYAVILLDDQNFTPKAVKLIDPTGNEETVHSFQKMQINRQLAARAFEPNLAGLKQTVTDTAVGPTPQPLQRTADTQPRKGKS